MDPRLLRYYNRELQHLREMGGEFATEYPKIASRLTLDSFECADPYVERLLEGFAFLAARVQLKIDSEFPNFTQHLLEIVYPHYLAPTPSMAVVQFEPDPKEGVLSDGFQLPRDTPLRSVIGKGDRTACEYRTAHDLTLWPLEIAEADYFTSGIEIATFETGAKEGVRAGLRIRLRTTSPLDFNELALETLSLYLRGGDEIAMQLYEQLLANTVKVVVRPATRPAPWQMSFEKECVTRQGFKDDEALIPYGRRSFQGYRLLHEHFAFPERFMFVKVDGLGPAVRRTDAREIDVCFLFDQSNPDLETSVDASQFALFCAPAINLFPKRGDRIHLSEKVHEYHVLPDRTRPMDFEVYQVTGVVGHGTSAEEQEVFLPFYEYNDLSRYQDHKAFFSVRRLPRVLSSNQRKYGPRSTYVGSEVFVALVDANDAPFSTDLRQLSLDTLCTNRDLALSMPVGRGQTDFTLVTGAPVKSARCVAGPTKPRASDAMSGAAWRLISHLSLNYLSLLDTDGGQGAAATREMLALYGGRKDASVQKQIEGLLAVTSKPINRWISASGLTSFARGLEVEVTFDETAFGGSGCFLMGAVLEEFFARYVSINSFTETVVKAVDRGEVVRWPARTGRRQLL